MRLDIKVLSRKTNQITMNHIECNDDRNRTSILKCQNVCQSKSDDHLEMSKRKVGDKLRDFLMLHLHLTSFCVKKEKKKTKNDNKMTTSTWSLSVNLA